MRKKNVVPVKKSKKSKKPLRGHLLLKAVVNHIMANPKKWNQGVWHCGTQHCVGGWCQILGGFAPDESRLKQDVTKVTGLTNKEAEYLFSSLRTLDEIYFFAKNYKRVGGYNRAGYNSDGIDKFGYDRKGYNLAGFDMLGYDKEGYDSEGYNKDGYDRSGYTVDGYNKSGYNANGFNKFGKRKRGSSKLITFKI